jgi:hypothetical protein
MRRLLPLVVVAGFILLAGSPHADAQKAKEKNPYAPGDVIMPSEEVLKQIADKTTQLADKVAELRKTPKHHELLPDVEIYLRAAQNIVRFKEFYHKNSGQWTLDCLDRGLQRAEQLAEGYPPWTKLGAANVARGFRSWNDETAQPYGVTYPAGYGKDVDKVWRVDIVLHGRGNTLTEVSFLNTHNGKKKFDPEQTWVQVDVYGRGNNAYRWAGEADVLQAMGAFFDGERDAGRGKLVDRERVVLRGFSMGGAGTWHLGLRFPSFWSVMGPGAGFTTTHGYAWKGKKDLPYYQEKCLRIYDAIDYVENARMIPIVAYSGADDAQKLAADNIESRLKDLKIDSMTHLVAPGVGHTFVPDYFKKANALWAEHTRKPRSAFPKKIAFTTYTTKAPTCGWVTVWGLEKHYEKAAVEGSLTPDECRLKTTNVSVLALNLPLEANRLRITIDDQPLKVPAGIHFFVKSKEKWQGVPFERFYDYEVNTGKRKLITRQGPIDDAFWGRFVCVLGSGDTWHPATQKWLDAKLAAFRYDWSKHWRGELPTIGDYAVTPNEIMDRNLILFGDPQSNLTLAQMLPKLPLKWTKDEIEFAGKKYKASEHVPVMIFPNPLNPLKYVVLNTGHTFPSEDYVKTNALLYPRLGDYAILRMAPTTKDAAAYDVATAGLFDEFWRVEKR